MPSFPGAKLPSGYSAYSLPTMGSDQKGIYDMLKGQFQGGAGDVYQKLFGMASGDEGTFDQLEKPALRQFNEVIAPGIASRYSGSGISNSSGMQNSIAGAGASLAEQLQSQRTGLMRQSMQDVLGLGNMLLGTPTQQFGITQKESLLRDLMQLLGTAGGQFGSTYGALKLAGTK